MEVSNTTNEKLENQKITKLDTDTSASNCINYGIMMERISEKLRKIAIANAVLQKKELGELLKNTLAFQKRVVEDTTLDNSVRTALTIRLDTLAWFMGGLAEDVIDLEKMASQMDANASASDRSERPEDFTPDYLG